MAPPARVPTWVGVLPSGEGWPWRQSQGPKSLLEGGLPPAPLTLPGLSPAPTHDSTWLNGL